MEPLQSPYISKEFSEIFYRYAERFQKERTKKEYRYVLTSLCNELGCDFLDITAGKIQEYFEKHKSDLDARTLKYQLRIFQALAKYLDEHAKELGREPNYLSCFLSLDFEAPDVMIEPRNLPSFLEIDKVLSHLKAQGDTSVFLAAVLALRCSLTIHEVVTLKQEMFFQDRNGNYGLRMKISTVNDRFVKLPEDVVELVRLHTKNRTTDSPYLLVNRRQKAMSIRSLQMKLRQACVDCEVSPFSMNDLRVLSTAMMIKEGASPDKIAEYIHIKNKDWFFRYDRVVEELNDAAVDYSHLKIVW